MCTQITEFQFSEEFKKEESPQEEGRLELL